MQTDPLIQRVASTDELMAQLTSVNLQVNSEIAYTTDLAKYNVADQWEDAALEGSQGDCEDYAIAKYHALRALGVPAGSMDIALCWDETNTEHAVLIVRMTPDDVCLDSRKYSPTTWSDEVASGYRFISTSVGGSINQAWRTVPDDAQPGAKTAPPTAL